MKNNPRVYTTREGMHEIKKTLRYILPKRVCKRLKNPHVYITQEGIEEIKKPSDIHYPRGYA